MQSVTTVAYSSGSDDKFLNMSQSTQSKQSCSYSSAFLMSDAALCVSQAPRASAFVCKKAAAAQQCGLTSQGVHAEESDLSLFCVEVIKGLGSMSGAGDMLMVFWEHCPKICLVKVPRDNKQPVRMHVPMAGYKPVEFTQSTLFVSLRWNVNHCHEHSTELFGQVEWPAINQ